MRSLAALLVLGLAAAGLAGCAPGGAGGRTVDVHGMLDRTAALSGLEGWILTTDAGPLLSVSLPDDAGDASDKTCVSISVAADFPVTDDQEEIAAALEVVMEKSGDSLEVVAFC